MDCVGAIAHFLHSALFEDFPMFCLSFEHPLIELIPLFVRLTVHAPKRGLCWCGSAFFTFGFFEEFPMFCLPFEHRLVELIRLFVRLTASHLCVDCGGADEHFLHSAFVESSRCFVYLSSITSSTSSRFFSVCQRTHLSVYCVGLVSQVKHTALLQV